MVDFVVAHELVDIEGVKMAEVVYHQCRGHTASDSARGMPFLPRHLSGVEDLPIRLPHGVLCAVAGEHQGWPLSIAEIGRNGCRRNPG